MHDPDRGTLTFSAESAVVSGPGVKRETAGAGDVLSGWTDPADRARWDVKPTRWGRYDVGIGGCGLRIGGRLGDGHASGHEPGRSGFPAAEMRTPRAAFPWAAFTREVGSVFCGGSALGCRGFRRIPAALRDAGRPAPEGEPIVQGADGVILLPSSQATTRSVTMRYEPATNKTAVAIGWILPTGRSGPMKSSGPAPMTIEVWQGAGAVRRQ